MSSTTTWVIGNSFLSHLALVLGSKESLTLFGLGALQGDFLALLARLAFRLVATWSLTHVTASALDPAGYLLKRQIIGRGEQGRHARDRRDLGRDREEGTLVQVETSLVPHARRSRDHYRP